MKALLNTQPIGGRAAICTSLALAASLGFVTPADAGGAPYSRIISLGGSLSDTGNLYELTGEIVPPEPYYSEGRFSNGPIWTEHLAESLGMVLWPGDQYAVGGAFTGEGNLNDYRGFPNAPYPGVSEQLAQLLADNPDGLDSRALFTVWTGANDFFATLHYVESLDPADPGYMQAAMQAFEMMIAVGISNTVEAVAILADHGARHILVVNLPDIGITPLGLANGPENSTALSAWIDAYNSELAVAMEALTDSGTPVIQLDSAGLIRDMIADPDAYGLTNVTDEGLFALAVGQDPTNFLFWDNVHPTSFAHAAVADLALEELIGFYRENRRAGNMRILRRLESSQGSDPPQADSDNSPASPAGKPWFHSRKGKKVVSRLATRRR